MMRRPPRSTLFPFTTALPIAAMTRPPAISRTRSRCSISILVPWSRPPSESAIADSDGGLDQGTRIEIEHRLRVRLIAGGRVIAAIGRAVVKGKRVDLGGRRIIKKKNKRFDQAFERIMA